MKRGAIFVVVSFLSVGCLLNPSRDPRFPVRTVRGDRKIVADSEARWKWWKERTENSIAAQKRNEPILDGGGPGSRRDYDGFWQEKRRALRQYQENHQRYVDYINRRLAEEGLLN